MSSEKLQMSLNDQRVIFNKALLKFNSLRKQKLLKNIFVKTYSENTSITYFKYNGSHHKAYNCNIKK